MDIPLPPGHHNKGKGGGKGKPKGSRARQFAPAEFKDSPYTVPTNFYYDVYKEMGAAEQYKREILTVKSNKAALEDFIANEYNESRSFGGDETLSLFDSAITCRDYDLVLAIKLEKST